jgi:hypothetical protein
MNINKNLKKKKLGNNNKKYIIIMIKQTKILKILKFKMRFYRKNIKILKISKIKLLKKMYQKIKITIIHQIRKMINKKIKLKIIL